MSLVFVYGTLKRGCSNHHLLAGQAFLGEARTPQGFALFSLGSHPGMVEIPADSGSVTGEVWSVDEECLEQLDALEGTEEGIYRRGAVPLLDPFAGRGVEAYFYLESLEGRKRLGEAWTE
ncbi:MAG TPA: gamma-glutamylcyclotransferase family protein [Opitutaceae bacterium]